MAEENTRTIVIEKRLVPDCGMKREVLVREGFTQVVVPGLQIRLHDRAELQARLPRVTPPLHFGFYPLRSVSWFNTHQIKLLGGRLNGVALLSGRYRKQKRPQRGTELF